MGAAALRRHHRSRSRLHRTPPAQRPRPARARGSRTSTSPTRPRSSRSSTPAAWSWQATVARPAGSTIAHRAMEKVFPADRFSAVAISGSAGCPIEMVRLFQVQLEHYEKVEGVALSLEGKANQLAQMVRTNLGLAMQGFVVVPLFCGYDVARGEGRIFDYDAAGGRYEEADYQATGSGGTYAKTTIRLGYRDAMPLDDAVELAILAAVRGRGRRQRDRRARPGPGHLPRRRDRLRAGLRPARRRRRRGALRRDHRAAPRRAGACGGHAAMTMPYYVAPEQVMKDRAEYAQKGIARGRAFAATIYDRGVLLVAENPSSHAPQDLRDLRPHRVRGRRQVQRVRPAPGRRRPPRRHQGLRLLPRGRRRAVARQPLRAVPRQRLHPRDEAAWRSRSSSPSSATGAADLSSSASPTRARSPTRWASRSSAATPTTIRARFADDARTDWTLCRGAAPRRGGRSQVRTAPWGPADLEVAVLSDVGARRTFRRLEDDEVALLLAD